jgi:hypothetical protein
MEPVRKPEYLRRAKGIQAKSKNLNFSRRTEEKVLKQQYSLDIAGYKAKQDAGFALWLQNGRGGP